MVLREWRERDGAGERGVLPGAVAAGGGGGREANDRSGHPSHLREQLAVPRRGRERGSVRIDASLDSVRNEPRSHGHQVLPGPELHRRTAAAGAARRGEGVLDSAGHHGTPVPEGLLQRAAHRRTRGSEGAGDAGRPADPRLAATIERRGL